jgi:hypothetical protein
MDRRYACPTCSAPIERWSLFTDGELLILADALYCGPPLPATAELYAQAYAETRNRQSARVRDSRGTVKPPA